MSDGSRETATRNLLTSLNSRLSRRTFFNGAMAVSLTSAGAALLPAGVAAAANAGDTASTNEDIDSVQTILNIAATAEQLAITFYTNGVMNAANLGLSDQNKHDFKAFAVEEQIHHDFFVTSGGVPLTDTFSFPHGAQTFTDLRLFIETQQQLEGAFDSAFIAAVYDFAVLNLPDLARITCMIAMVEEGHRTIGRQILHLDPAENVAYAPQLVAEVGDAPAVLQAAGYLSPVPGNTYTYRHLDFNGVTYGSMYDKIMYKKPFVTPDND